MDRPKNPRTSGGGRRRRTLLLLNCLLLAVGNCGGPLISRLYFLHGGHRVWLSSFLETAGFPILLPILVFRARRPTMRPRLLLAAAVVGLLTGLDDYLYAYGVARLPISTSALIIASQLAFTAAFALLLVGQRFRAHTVNAVVLLTIGAGVLALNTSGDRPAGEGDLQYFIGFATTVGAAALYGFVLPLVELSYRKAGQEMTYGVVVEFQVVMCFFASAFCAVGMFFNNDFKVIPREARNYDLGETKYYVVLALSAFLWQCFFLGAIGVIFCASSLLSGIIIAVLLPVTEILAVVFYKEKFQAQKGISLALSLWGFVSYFYGEIKQSKKMKKLEEEAAEFTAQNDQNP